MCQTEKHHDRQPGQRVRSGASSGGGVEVSDEKETMIQIPEKRYLKLIRIEEKLGEIIDDLRYAVNSNVQNPHHYAGQDYVSILVDEIKRLKAGKS